VLVISAQQSSSSNLPLMLSRSHAKLAVMEGHLQLWDCGSVNGTWVNTQQIQKKTWRVLQDGDVLTFGERGGPLFRRVEGRGCMLYAWPGPAALC
jgi:pSer/pThr/pTyr-binding forkhead associated (FHA) protein